MVRRAEMRLHRNLQHRHVGLRIGQQQRHPGAVVQAAGAVDAGLQPGGTEQVGNLLGQRRSPGAR